MELSVEDWTIHSEPLPLLSLGKDVIFMFIEATQDLGDVKRKIMLNMLEVVKFYPNQSRGGCTIEMKDGKKIVVTDIYDALAKRTLIAQCAR